MRDIEALEKLATGAGLALAEVIEMPSNNLTLVFARSKTA